MAKTARRWSPLDKAAVRILAKIREDDLRDLSYRQMAKMTGMTPSRLSGLFLETMGPPTLDEFCTLCELFDKSAPQTLQSAIIESQQNVSVNHDDGADAALADADDDSAVPDMSGWSADEQAAYVASHLDQFDIAAKHGDIEREQEAFEEQP
ncbi:helix-turn-helix domain-containing protein [Bifidobacterium pseudolongum]|uniref:helix-turn-helix domain-containing protein n=1 Tax=Bifidobacterium pseudolongum TaxID=1694 RepID=UPI0010209B4A|nr:helix-turn-helix transcriptional regulator [Bifidobacterium pseudolongum]